MRRWVRRLGALALLAGLLFLLALMRTPPEQLTASDGAHVYVIDGDSLRIGERTVRIEGVDAVELHQLCRTGDGAEWNCGLDARSALQKMVARGALLCTAHAADKFGRTLASCSANGVPDLAADLVTQGWAVSGDGEADGRYGIQQAEARANASGIWRGRFDRPADWRAAHPRNDIATDP